MNRRFSLALTSFYHQLWWALPMGLLGYYCYNRLPFWCDSYFGVSALQQAPLPSVIPAVSFIDSFRTFMTETTFSAKLYMLSTVSNLTTLIGRLILCGIGFVLLGKLISKCRTAYLNKQRDSDLVLSVISELQPEIRALRQEVATLLIQLKKGKNQ